MPLTRMYEESEVSADLRRIYDDVRTSLDLPWVPSVFKLAAGSPAYLKSVWDDLGPVARSKEFHAASKALGEFVRSLAVSDGWRFSDQNRILSAQKFSVGDIEQMGAVVSLFARAIPRLALFARLMQRGYSGGQRGRVSSARQASALARMIKLNIPGEREAGLRAWLIYGDIRKTLGTKNVLSLFRVISPYPGYLASVWMDTKKVISQPSFRAAQERVAKRSLGLMAGMPVRDHRKMAKNVSPEEWRDIESMVDTFARVVPQLALVSTVWQRTFPNYGTQVIAA
ncbi:MAG: halocarboxylic acid dehydrogenase DehI family protein [Terriglobales bacterium]